MRRPVTLIALTALAVTGCGDSGSPTAGPSTVPSSSIPITDDPATTPTGTPTGTPSDTPTDTPSPAPTSQPPTSASGCVDQKLQALTLREKAAQLIMTGINSGGMTSAQRSVVQRQKSGSVFLIGNSGSLSHTRTAMAAVNTAATVKGVRPLIAADQEGGQIQRLKGDRKSVV